MMISAEFLFENKSKEEIKKMIEDLKKEKVDLKKCIKEKRKSNNCMSMHPSLELQLKMCKEYISYGRKLLKQK